ncbi:MAG: YigZ family protein [Thermoanaerobaculaceae bacterium]|nr:YigZ family protein [Thermoanaerobaculaceae bacterium]
MRVDRVVTAKHVVERSRFHAMLTPVAALDEMHELVKTCRREHRRANHHCWACRLRDERGGVQESARDDGEVGHPGQVLLEVLRKYDLEGAVIVSRVFGGVKLGVGGVSRAFREAAELAVAAFLAERGG